MIPTPKTHRRLKAGELIKSGDLFQDSDCDGKFYKEARDIGQRVLKGMAIKYYRPLKKPKKKIMRKKLDIIHPTTVWVCQPDYCNKIGLNYIFPNRSLAVQKKVLSCKGSMRMFKAIITPYKGSKK